MIDPRALRHGQLGQAYESAGRDLDALREFRAAEQFAPGYEGAMKIGGVLLRLGMTQDAIDSYCRALDFRPNEVAAWLALCRAQADLFRDEDAFRSLDRAAEIEPHSWEAPLARAHLLQMRGRFAEAENEFEAALVRRPGLGIAYQGLVGGRRLTEDNRPLLGRIRQALEMRELSPADQAALRFSLGKGLDDLGEYETAMAEFEVANRITFALRIEARALDRAGLSAQIDARVRLFPSELPTRAPGGNSSERPVFVVGMLRSGTTLLEQLLSAHPAVAAAGELRFWAHAEAHLVDHQRGAVDWGGVATAAEDYLRLTDEFARMRAAGDGVRVTDKFPANFFALGIIHAAFPNARIIHMRRHPVNTALSIYMTPLRTPPNYGCDKAHIAFFFGEYLRLMAHWRKVLPAARFLDVDYEELVADGEGVMRRVLEFCGLPWNEACRHPDRNPRSVRTPSFWQVRQPLYSSSVGRWRHYIPWLGAFEGLLT